MTARKADRYTPRIKLFALIPGLFFLTATAFAQPNDVRIIINGPDHVVAGSFANFRMSILSGDGNVPADQRVTGRLTVPRQLTPISTCGVQFQWDPASRLMTWSDNLNQYLWASNCGPAFLVDPATPDGTPITLTASCSTNVSDNNSANDSANLTAIINASADIEVKTTPSAPSLTPGSNLVYTITVTNLGALEARNVVLSDNTAPITQFISITQTSGPAASILTPLPGGYGTVIARMDTLPPGASATFELLVRIDPAVENYVLINQPSVHSDDDPNQGNNLNSVFVLVGPDADLKVASRAPDTRETRFPITIDVGNDGPQTVKSVDVELAINGDLVKVKYWTVTPSQGTCSEPVIYSMPMSPPLPPVWRVQCTLGTFVPGATATITAIIDTKPVKTMFTHSVSVTAYNDPNPPNNQSVLVLTNYSKGRTRAVRK